MSQAAHEKVSPEHLGRSAYLYVRQSTLRQMRENTESTERQYDLRRRAIALGWAAEQVIVIDGDQGHSGASTEGRKGFQQLVAEVGMGLAGIVMGLEVSRLARNNADWYRLLQICALTETLILDEDGVYDPTQFNDRMLLGMKGAMSEAELHVIRARLQGGLVNKARKGELKVPLPVGLIYDGRDKVVFDSDRQVQETIRFFFQSFRQTGSAYAAIHRLRDEGLSFPRRLRSGPDQGALVWGWLTYGRALSLLRNPRYAGAFCFGRTRQRQRIDGSRVQERRTRDRWIALLPGAHEGYISWEEYEENQRRLRDNANATGADHRGPPREGPALLQGLLICGRCGAGMTVRYRVRVDSRRVPIYECGRLRSREAGSCCQSIPGAGIDAAVGEMLLEAVTPVTIEVALSVQKESQARIDEADRLRHRQVERARYETELARRRYMTVDPENRLVADSLEANWNDKLRALAEAQQDYERQRQADRVAVSNEQRTKILSLATDFPRLWRDPQTPDRERKRMVRLLVEDATLTYDDVLTAHVRFKGGVTRTLTIPRPTGWAQRHRTSANVVEELDRLLDDHTPVKVAEALNARGFESGCGQPFDVRIIAYLCKAYGIKSREARLHDAGLLTLDEVAARLGIDNKTVKRRRIKGTLGFRAEPLDAGGRYMYEDPDVVSGERPTRIPVGGTEVQYGR